MRKFGNAVKDDPSNEHGHPSRSLMHNFFKSGNELIRGLAMAAVNPVRTSSLDRGIAALLHLKRCFSNDTSKIGTLSKPGSTAIVGPRKLFHVRRE